MKKRYKLTYIVEASLEEQSLWFKAGKPVLFGDGIKPPFSSGYVTHYMKRVGKKVRTILSLHPSAKVTVLVIDSSRKERRYRLYTFR